LNRRTWNTCCTPGCHTVQLREREGEREGERESHVQEKSHMFACVCVRAYICVVCMCVFARVCLRACVYVCLRAFEYVRIHVVLDVCVRMCECACVEHDCAHAHRLFAHIYTYTHSRLRQRSHTRDTGYIFVTLGKRVCIGYIQCVNTRLYIPIYLSRMCDIACDVCHTHTHMRVAYKRVR
jgi:hypothetical protein